MAKARVAKKRPPKKHSALDHLAYATGEILDMRNMLEIHRLAVVGAIHEATSLKLPMDALLEYIRPVTEGLANLEAGAYGVGAKLMDAGKRLHREKGRRS